MHCVQCTLEEQCTANHVIILVYYFTHWFMMMPLWHHLHLGQYWLNNGLMTPSHYLDQGWLIIRGLGTFTWRIFHRNYLLYGSFTIYLEITYPKLQPDLHSNKLTLWGRDKMVAFSQATFSNAWSWMKMYEFCLRFHWGLFLMFESTIFH